MTVAYSSGLELLRKQRLERSKRLDGLNFARYFQDMEKLRNGLEPSNHTKKYMLVRYN